MVIFGIDEVINGGDICNNLLYIRKIYIMLEMFFLFVKVVWNNCCYINVKSILRGYVDIGENSF